MGVADFIARSAPAFAGGFLGTFDQTAIGDEVLDPWEAGNVVDFVEQHEAKDFANTGHGLEQIEGSGIVLLGCLNL